MRRASVVLAIAVLVAGCANESGKPRAEPRTRAEFERIVMQEFAHQGSALVRDEVTSDERWLTNSDKSEDQETRYYREHGFVSCLVAPSDKDVRPLGGSEQSAYRVVRGENFLVYCDMLALPPFPNSKPAISNFRNAMDRIASRVMPASG